jgi:hypothetical protein
MIERSIPRDISKYETKQVLGLTTRQLCLFAPGAVIGIVLFVSLKDIIGDSAMFVGILAALPFVLFATLKPLGLPLEKYIATALLPMLLSPAVRKYVTANTYDKHLNHVQKNTERKNKKYKSADPMNTPI